MVSGQACNVGGAGRPALAAGRAGGRSARDARLDEREPAILGLARDREVERGEPVDAARVERQLALVAVLEPARVHEDAVVQQRVEPSTWL